MRCGQALCSFLQRAISFDYFTVSTPGSAAKGISVAASDNAVLSHVSVPKDLPAIVQLKPDRLSAPGVSITSSFPGGIARTACTEHQWLARMLLVPLRWYMKGIHPGLQSK